MRHFLFTAVLFLFPSLAWATPYDYVFQFPDSTTALNSAVMQQFIEGGSWNLTIIAPIKVLFRSTGLAIDSNYYIEVSDPNFRYDLASAPNCVAVFDRAAAKASQPWVLSISTTWTNTQLNTFWFSGAFAGNNYDQVSAATETPPFTYPTIPTEPAQGIAAGFTTLALNENFTSVVFQHGSQVYTQTVNGFAGRPGSVSGDNGVIWYCFGVTQPSGGDLCNTPSGTEIGSVKWLGRGNGVNLRNGMLLNTHAATKGEGLGVNSQLSYILASSGGYYVEASMKQVGAYGPSLNWVSFWTFSAAAQEGFPTEWLENDVIETPYYPMYAAGCHDWHSPPPGGTDSPPGQQPPYGTWNTTVFPANNLNNFHTYGGLITPSAHTIDYYFDNTYVQTCSLPSTSIISDPVSVIISSNSSVPGNSVVQWVHAWCTSTTNACGYNTGD